MRPLPAGTSARASGRWSRSTAATTAAGYSRTRPARLALTAARAGLDVRGVFTFPGHSYAPDQLGQAAVDEARTLTEAAESLRAAGIEPTVVSGGSTPSLSSADTDVLTELRPGVYVFGDAQQWELGSMSPDEVALTCRSTVVSHSGGRLVLDAGSKALGADRASWATGYGRLLEHPEARIVLLSEHHAVADLGDAPLPAIGSRVDVVPNHVCNAVNLADTMYVEDAGVLTAWPVVARGSERLTRPPRIARMRARLLAVLLAVLCASVLVSCGDESTTARSPEVVAAAPPASTPRTAAHRLGTSTRRPASRPRPVTST